MTALSNKFVRAARISRHALLLAAAGACGAEEAASSSRADQARARAVEARAAGSEDGARFWMGIAAEEPLLEPPFAGTANEEARELHDRGRRRLDEAGVMIGYQSTDQDVVREALLSLEEAVGREPWVAEYQYGAGYGWFLAREFDRAEVRFEAAILLDPDHFGALQGLGTIHLNAGRAELARGPLERVVELRPEDANGHYVLGKCREEQGEFEASEASYRRSLELHPGLIEPYNRLGGVLLRVGREAEGRRMLDEFLWWKQHEIALRGRAPTGPRGAPALEALEARLAGLSAEDPGDAHLAVAHARVLAALGRSAELREALRRARRAASEDPDVLLDVAREWHRIGDFQRAVTLLGRALETDEGHLEARLELAAVFESGGRMEVARKHYRRALQISPGCERARRALADGEPDE